MIDFIIEKPNFKNQEYNVLDFGAKSDIKYNNQSSFQKAIDECSVSGGGKVIIPSGFYLTGPIQLKSNVNLHLEENSFIQFTKSKEEYPLVWTEYEGQKRIRAISPISANDCENIAITGSGIIDGNGFLWRGIKDWKLTKPEWNHCLTLSPYVIKTSECQIWYPTKTAYEGTLKGEVDYKLPNALELASEHYDLYRPVLLSLVQCDKILIEGVTFQNSPAWNIHPLYCKNLTMRNAIIKNKFYAQNGDGLDLESCENCEIDNCVFEVGDDGICLKAGKNREARNKIAPTKNVYIHNCKVFHAHGGFVVGSEMSRGVYNVIVDNCTFIGTDVGIRFKSAIGRGGLVENIKISNIYMNDIVDEAIIFTMGYVLYTMDHEKPDIVETTAEDDIPEFRNITIDNVVCNGANIGLKIAGLQQLPINNIRISNSKIKCEKAIETSLCENIVLENVVFESKGKKYEFTSEVISGNFNC